MIVPANAPFSVQPMFSIVWITDTQYMSERFPENFDSLCNWIVDYSEVLNIKAVIHTGDMVQHPESLGEWNRASHSIGILLKKNIPYCWDAGNHDKLGSSWYGKSFRAFDTKLMSGKDYWVDDILDGKNTALYFRAADWDFLIINMEFQPTCRVMNWANQLIERYPNCHTIIATHAYLNGVGEYEEWTHSYEQSYFEEKVLGSHSNVFLTLNGHFQDGNTGRTFAVNRHELFFNYQHTGGEGDATLRILTFSREEDAIFVNTINIVTNQFLTDPENCFTLDIPFFEKSDKIENLALSESLDLTKYDEKAALPEVQYITSSMFTCLLLMTLIKRKIRNTPNC